MKKAVMFSVATLLAATTMATQAQEAKPADAPVADAAVSAEAAPADQATADAAPADTAAADAAATDAAAQPAKPAEEAPKDSPQVAKLVAMYPKLIARIEPFGKVCFDGEECDINIVALPPAVEGQARDGDVLYKAICSTCHDAGLVGAPKFGNAGDWGPRIGKGKETLYNHAINGFNAMPARGGADLSDDEVKNAVNYIIEHSS